MQNEHWDTGVSKEILTDHGLKKISLLASSVVEREGAGDREQARSLKSENRHGVGINCGSSSGAGSICLSF